MKIDTKPYKKALEKWCINSTMDGLPSIARAKRHLLHIIFWILLFLLCFGLCVYMVSKSIIDYFQYDVITTDRIVAYDKLDFPVVTFCNENMYLSPQANMFIRDYFLANFNLSVNSYNDIVKRFGSFDQADKEISWMTYQLSAGKWNNTVLKSLGYSVEDTFMSFQFSVDDVNKSIDLEWYFDKMYGNCYRFNANQNFKALRLGYGLYAQIFTGLPFKYHKPILNIGEAKGESNFCFILLI